MQRLDWRRVEKCFHRIDTFSGPVLAQYSREERDGALRRIAEEAMSRGPYVTDLERVRVNYAEWANVEIVKGVVPEVLQAVHIESVAFLHLDMNCAYPERAALEYFWNFLSPGAVVLLDDYAYFGCESIARAIDDAAAVLRADVLSLPTGQGLIIK